MNDSMFDFSELRRRKEDDIILPRDGSSQDEALLKSFQELRQKLKLSQREVASLKDDLKVAGIKSKQSQESLNSTLTSNIQLKEKVSSLTSQNQELKKNLALMKETIQKQANYQQEIQFTKQALLNMKTQIDKLMQEREKILEMALGEKLSFQEEINRLKSKIESDSGYIEQLEITCSKNKQTILKQENQIKKISISFQEELFTKNWSKDNFETQHLLTNIKELQKEVNILKAKNKKEKEKRVILEDKIIQLEELSGFHNVKAETFQGEIDMITKKYSKLDKKYKETKEKLEKVHAQRLEFEQNLTKSLFQSEELTKKLKGLNIQQVNSCIQQYQTKISSLASKTQEIQETLTSIQTSTSKILDRPINNNNKETSKNNFYSFNPSPSKVQEEPRKVLAEYRGNTPRQEKPMSRETMYGSNLTFGDRQQDENTIIQNRIRREREEMERRIKEKMLCRKMQSSVPGEQFKLRGEYIRTFIDRKY